MLIRPINESDNKHIAVILREVLIEMDIPRIGSAFEDPEIDNMFESYQSNRSKYFVVEENNKIIVGPKRYLSCDEFLIHECNWIAESDQKKFDALVKLRNTAKPVEVEVKVEMDLESSSANVKLKMPELGISPGQAAVFYDLLDENRVLGGGWIKSTKNYLNG